jgi:predicted ferric reductase
MKVLEPIDTPIEEAYREADEFLRIRYFKIGSIIGVVLIAGGCPLDYMIYKPFFWTILQIRLLAVILVASLFSVVFARFGQRHIKWLGILCALLMNLPLILIIIVTEGVNSPYMEGLILLSSAWPF